MPRTSFKRKSKALASSSASNGSPSEVLTLAQAAAYLQLSEQNVLQLVREQGLPARQVGTEWRLLKAAIDQWLSSGPASLEANKEAWLALAGKYHNDPDLEQIVENAYRRRGRPITEEGSYKNFSS